MDLSFLTGATGFLGANLARLLLEKGQRVRVLARRGGLRSNLDGLPVEIVEGDLGDKAALRSGCAGARYVFHLAADYRLWVPDPGAMRAANVDGTVAVLEAAAEAGAERVVHCSSVAAVKPLPGRAADEGSQYAREDEIIGPYKRSKWRAERAALELARRGLPVVVVNPSAPIGPWDVKPTPTGRIVLDFLNRRLPSYIDTGLNVVHARDAAEGHYLAALRGRIGERYILGGENLRFGELLRQLAELTGLPAPRWRAPYWAAWIFSALDTARAALLGTEPRAPWDAVRMARVPMFYDHSKAARELGYSPLPARAALEDAVAWFLANGYVRHEESLRRLERLKPAPGRASRGGASFAAGARV